METATFHHGSEYTTRSLSLVAALEMGGFTPKGTGQHWTGKKTFVYDRSPALEAAVSAFIDGTLLLSARDFSAKIVEVKHAHFPYPHN